MPRDLAMTILNDFSKISDAELMYFILRFLHREGVIHNYSFANLPKLHFKKNRLEPGSTQSDDTLFQELSPVVNALTLTIATEKA